MSTTIIHVAGSNNDNTTHNSGVSEKPPPAAAPSSSFPSTSSITKKNQTESSSSSNRFRDKILRREPGVITFGLTPPRVTLEGEKLETQKLNTIRRLSSMPIDAAIIYDIHEEGERDTFGHERPFPFVNTIDGATWMNEEILPNVPKSVSLITYRCIQKHQADELAEHCETYKSNPRSGGVVYVGAASNASTPSISLCECYDLHTKITGVDPSCFYPGGYSACVSPSTPCPLSPACRTCPLSPACTPCALSPACASCSPTTRTTSVVGAAASTPRKEQSPTISSKNSFMKEPSNNNNNGNNGNGNKEYIMGAVAIPERHAKKGDEHMRMIFKQKHGCRFFCTQIVYCAKLTKKLLKDYADECKKENMPVLPILLTFAPVGGMTTLKLMKYLGVCYEEGVEDFFQKCFTEGTLLQESVAEITKILLELCEFCKELKIPIGVNIESVAIKKEEAEAAEKFVTTARTIFQKCYHE